MGQPQGIEYETIEREIANGTPPSASVPTSPDLPPVASGTDQGAGSPSAESDKSAI